MKLASKINFRFLLTGLLILCFMQYSFGAFRNMQLNTRARGMGGAYTAVSDDVGALTYNVAGLGLMEWFETNLLYSQLYTGLDGVDIGLYYVGMAYPLKNGYGTIGFDWSKYTTKDLYSEDVAQLAYGYTVNPQLSLGVGLAYLSHSYELDDYTKDDPVFKDGRSKSALGINFGALYILSDMFSLGVSARNVNRPDVGLKTEDIVPPEYRLGTTFISDRFTIPFDIYYRDQEWGKQEDKIGYSLGTEYWTSEIFAIRAGFNKTEITGGFSFFQNEIIRGWDIGISYALIWPLEIEETTGSHQLSLTLRYGKSGVGYETDLNDSASLPKYDSKDQFTLEKGRDAKVFEDVDAKIDIVEGLSADGKNIAELLINGKQILKVYTSYNGVDAYGRLKNAAKKITDLMKLYTFVDADFTTAVENGVTYIVLHGEKLLAVDSDAKAMNVNKDALAKQWNDNLKTALVKDTIKGKILETANLQYGIKVIRRFSEIGEIGEITVDDKSIITLYVVVDGVSPYKRALETARKLQKYITEHRGASTANVVEQYGRMYVSIAGEDLITVDYEAEYLKADKLGLANKWLELIKQVLDKKR